MIGHACGSACYLKTTCDSALLCLQVMCMSPASSSGCLLYSIMGKKCPCSFALAVLWSTMPVKLVWVYQAYTIQTKQTKGNQLIRLWRAVCQQSLKLWVNITNKLRLCSSSFLTVQNTIDGSIVQDKFPLTSLQNDIYDTPTAGHFRENMTSFFLMKYD